MIRTAVRLCSGRVRPSVAYARFVDMRLLEPNDYQRDAMTHADRLYADLTRLLAEGEFESQARIAASSPPPNHDDGAASPHAAGDEDGDPDAPLQGTLGDALPSVFVTSKRRMPKRDLVPPPRKHLGLIPQQYLQVEMMRQRELELGLRSACHPLSDIRGLYLYGGVGCGKTAAMNILFHELPTQHKKRTNFRQFVEEATKVYDDVFRHHKWESKDSEAVTNEVGVRLCSTAEVVMLDDVRLQSADEAVLMRRIFSAMYRTGICTVFTAQKLPEQLLTDTYRNRKAVEPFVAMLRQRCDIIDMGHGVDYRMEAAFRDVGTFLSPATHGAEARKRFNQGFLELTDARIPKPRTIRAYGRDIELSQTVGDVCRVTFDSLMADVCVDDADFELLARAFHTVFIEGVPQFDQVEDTAVLQRFFKLVDFLHANGTKTVLLADAGMAQLVAGPLQVALHGGAADDAARIAASPPALSGATLSEPMGMPQETKRNNPVDDALAAATGTDPAVLQANERAITQHREFMLALQTCERQLAVMQTPEYLRTPHHGEPVTLLDGAPNKAELLERLRVVQEEEKARGFDEDELEDGELMTRAYARTVEGACRAE